MKISDPIISDHCAVHFNLRVQKPHFTKKRVNYRKLRSVDTDSFCEDNLSSPLLQDQATELVQTGSGCSKNIRRRLERKWHSTRLQRDREQYGYQCYVVNNLIDSLKSTYYNDIIKGNIHHIRRYYLRLSDSANGAQGGRTRLEQLRRFFL